jgi:hypothetical protein
MSSSFLKQRASQTVQGAMLLAGAVRVQHAVLLLKGDAVRHGYRELALRPLHVDLAALQRDLHAGRDWNRFATNT